MKKQIDWLREKINHFISALDNKPDGMSLRKILAVAFFWLTSYVTMRYTDTTNIVMVITILTGMITALVITYTVGNIKEKGMEQSKSPDSPKSEENG